ncbi:MAG: hypothetical protein K2Q10_12350 [Rhodospirillales bacterium]|nr:hypothetical protein [Rhodospirillales bacterium]
MPLPEHLYPGRHQALLTAYGFGLFPIPDYRDAAVGEWRICRHLPSIAQGYTGKSAIEPFRAVLYRGRTPWMSTGLMEQESHAYHVHQAHGIVVIAGLGMGMFAYAAAIKPEVEQVVVVDIAPEVMRVMRQATSFEAWPCRDKVTIIEADALSPGFAEAVLAVTGGRRPDYLYADIWPAYGADEAPGETAAMVRALAPRAAGWWGQEVSLGQWCRPLGRQPDIAAWADYAAGTGIPVLASEGYAAFCREVIAAHGLLAGDGPLRRLWRALAG